MGQTVNRNYVYPDEFDDDWFNVFVSLMDSIDADIAAALAGQTTLPIVLNFATPYLRLIGTEGSAKDWRMVESGGDILFQLNTNTQSIPVWATIFAVGPTGDIKVFTAGSGIILRDSSNTRDVRVSATIVDGQPVLSADFATFT